MSGSSVNRQRWHDHRLFLTHFRKSPRTIGAIAPSSQRLARAMIDGLTFNPGVRVVELGPGTGAVTGEIARRLPADGICLAVDIDPVFASRISARWARIESLCARAEDLARLAAERHMLPVDHIVSGLPFASLPASTTREIVDAIAATLRSGGTFTTFQYVHAYAFPSAVDVRRLVTRLTGTRPISKLVVGNVPPALVYRWRKVK
jgi:phosphatidylethanolamine/phosphatidyl-N-methylethanolamine N-methyltransferase